MMFFAPLCVVVGCLFPDQLGRLSPLVPYLFTVISFQGSLSNTARGFGYELRHPRLLIVTILISAVFMPTLGCLLGRLLFGAEPNIVCGIVLEYSVPIATISVMWNEISHGNQSLALATLLVSSVLSPLTLPAALQVLVGQTVQVDVVPMMREILFTVAIPAVIGTIVNDATHGGGKAQISPVIAPLARIFIIIVIATNATKIAPFMRDLSPMLVAVLVFIGIFSASGYLWGLLASRLMRVSHEDSVTMTFGAGMRNISAGAVIAAQYFPGEVMFPVIIGTLFQQILASIYDRVLRQGRPAEA